MIKTTRIQLVLLVSYTLCIILKTTKRFIKTNQIKT